MFECMLSFEHNKVIIKLYACKRLIVGDFAQSLREDFTFSDSIALDSRIATNGALHDYEPQISN
jgi:hypothetical protein